MFVACVQTASLRQHQKRPRLLTLAYRYPHRLRGTDRYTLSRFAQLRVLRARLWVQAGGARIARSASSGSWTATVLCSTEAFCQIYPSGRGAWIASVLRVDLRDPSRVWVSGSPTSMRDGKGGKGKGKGYGKGERRHGGGKGKGHYW